ncbi:MAG: extracellular solute-binding protein [Elusimicrobiota bacterium]|jgi:multiple sugar transport system substrate-binding protein
MHSTHGADPDRTAISICRARLFFSAGLAAMLSATAFAASSPAPAAPAHEGRITVWAMGAEGKLIRKLADMFEAENPGAKVLTQAIPWDAAHEKLVTAIVGGMAPDVSQMGSTWMPEFQGIDALARLDDFAALSKPAAPANFFSGSLTPTCYNGRRYGIPWYVDTRVMFYRTDLAAQAGFSSFPTTWEGFLKLSRELVRRNSRPGDPKYAFSLPTNDWQFLLMFLWQNGGELLPQGRQGPVFASGGLEGALSYLKTFFDEKLAPLEPSRNSDPLVAFETGYFPIFLAAPWMIYELERSKPQLAGKWATARLPGKKASISFIGGSDLVIFNQSKNKALAWKFVEFLSRPDIQVRWYEISKDLPAVKAAWKHPSLNSNPLLAPFKAHLDSAKSPPPVPEWESMANALNESMEEVMFGKTSVEEARAKLSERIRGLLNQSAPKQSVFFRLAVTALLFLLPVLLVAAYFAAGSAPLSRKKKPQYAAFAFLLPSLSILAVFLFLPVVASFAASLTNWNLSGLNDLSRVAYVGFANYIRLFQDPVFLIGLRNTLIFAFIGVPLSVSLSLFMALCVNRRFLRWKAAFRIGYFIPVITTMVAVAIIWRWLYNPVFGVFNLALAKLHLPMQNWLTDPRLALPSLILMALWKGFGYNTIIFVAALQSIPESLYESIEIDGANTRQRFWYLTLPMLQRTTFFIVIMTTIGYFQFFAEPYIMTGGGPLNATMSVVLYMYQHGFKFYNLGYSSAMAYVLFACIFTLTLLQRRLQRSLEGE